jgi:tripartite-type tricarboxylate transporter receptor subunit TctC
MAPLRATSALLAAMSGIAMDRPKHLVLNEVHNVLRFCALALAFSTFSAWSVTGQEPGQPITLVVPYSAGTGPDILARTIGEELQQRRGQVVIIENRPGASGNIGTQMVARAVPDGHTLLMIANPFTANVSLMKSVPYDPVKNFAPIIKVATGSLALTVHPSVPARSVTEFIGYVKLRPGQLNYSSPGIGTPHHLAMELLKLTAKIDLKHVPYKGSAGATQDLVGGHVSAAFQAVHVAVPLTASNQLRLLGVASKERSPAVPQVPTLTEDGLPIEVDLWFGVLAPAGTAAAIVGRYNKEINEIIGMPQIAERLAKQGLTVVGGTPERLGDFIAQDMVRWQKVVWEAGIGVE